jgi:hypothetical protein
MTGNQHEDGQSVQPTLAGCLLTVLSLAVIFGSAFPIMRWRDPDTGDPMPRELAVLLPVLAGALFYGVGSALLASLGLRVLKPKKEQPSRE